MSLKNRTALFIVLIAPVIAGLTCQAEVAARSETKPPPEEVSDAVKSTLGKQCHQVVKDGELVLEFWPRENLPVTGKPASIDKALDTLATASLFGVVRLHRELRDYRDDKLAKGVYTMRFGKILADGNHLGASEFPYFAVLIPAAKDKAVDGINTFKSMTQASAKETSSEHPMVISLRPVKEKPPNIPAVTEPAPDHKSLVVVMTGKPEGADQPSELLLAIVFEGTGKI
jgi:hypothetical protein